MILPEKLILLPRKTKTITTEQKVGIIQRYKRGESTNAIRLALDLPESTLRTIRKDKEKILAAFKAGTGASASRVSSGQPEFMVRLEKMLVIWMVHQKRQDAQKKALEVYEHLKAKETSPVPDLLPAGVGFKISWPNIPSAASSALGGQRALTLLLLSRTS